MPLTTLAQEIKKRHPFESLEEEAYLNLWRTFNQLSEGLDRLIAAHGLCATHYNILRILVGEAAANGLPVLEVRERLITRVPDITRLVDKLVEMGLVRRVRTEKDRRLVLPSTTSKGTKLVESFRRPLLEMHHRQLGHMARGELKQLCELLAKARMIPD